MPAKPLLEIVALSLRVPRGAEGFWSIILDLGCLGTPFTLADIDGRSNVGRDTISDYVRRLVKGGFLAVASVEREGSRSFRRYRLARTSREAPRLRRDGTAHPETARDRMWRAMKMLDTWTWADLAAATETETLPPVPAETVKSYLRRLDAAGVVQALDKGGPNRPATYRLKRNIGAAAPRILRTHAVFDPNSGTVLDVADGEDVA